LPTLQAKQMVVSNASPLLNLALIGRLEWLRLFYGTIHIPEAVWTELSHAGVPKTASAVIAPCSWIETHAIKNRHLVTALLTQLDAGEAEAIALALELEASLLLLDESEGRRVAASYQLRKTGTVGILLHAKRQGLIPSLRDEMRKLQRDAHFWISAPLYEQLLQAAGE